MRIGRSALRLTYEPRLPYRIQAAVWAYPQTGLPIPFGLDTACRQHSAEESIIGQINPDIFKELAADASAWRTKATTLRSAAQSLWDSFNEFLAADPGHLKSKDEQSAILYRYAERLHTSQLLYGLATETALKARIIENDPKGIEFREKKDGQGNIVDLQILRIGVELGKDGHDLVKLAQAAGVADGGSASLVESDRIVMNEILAYLTDLIHGGREH